MKKNNRGFTLIELIVYVALIAIFVTGAIQFGINVVYGRVKSNVVQEVTQNLRLTSKKVMFEVRNASGINSVSATSICLSNSDASRNPTRIYLSGTELRIGWGGGSPVCAGLTSDFKLTSNLVEVTSLTFTNLTTLSTRSKNIKFTLTIDSLNPSGRAEYERSQTFTGSAEVRSN
jgi:prepilin-type N-terminal cleavage/methylation domain-containing protein